MRRLIPSQLSICLLVMFIMVAAAVESRAVVYDPPGPASANPALQPDGLQVPDVFGTTPNWNLTPPLRKFVDTLAPVGCTSANNLGQCVPVAVPDRLTFPGSDYYEIELRRYTEKVHTDLPNPTTFQGYVQVNNGTNAAGTANNVAPAGIHYLGPIIVAQKDRPVRIKFVNKLPLENVDPFPLPVDRSVMGAGMGSKDAAGNPCDPVWDPRGVTNPATGLPYPTTEPTCAKYATNRGELHLHGGLNPWISDGTPHQWITPAGEATPYQKGDSVKYVPDMWFDGAGNVIAACAGQVACGAGGASNDPGPGAQTYYYTNAQSARLMFYHDHSYGITRLNVYAGEAAGYVIQDAKEQDLVTRGVIPSDNLYLIVQDKNFVDASTIGTLDPTWVWGTGAKTTKWLDANGAEIVACAGLPACGTAGARKMIVAAPKTGDLWWPHVYMPAENPADLGGVNAMGRWVYGMYFWPPTTDIKFLPTPNPYYDCDPLGVCNRPWEPPTTPATPNPSWVAEAFVDTPMINGTVYPTVTVQPKAYRFRILNASHDRFFNLQLYEADGTVNPNVTNPQCATFTGGCATQTEVKMVPAIKYPAFPLWDAAADQRAGGVPDPATAGPAWIQIGNEGGFLPAPVVIPNQPISFVTDPTLFNVGNVNDGTVILGPAERADVILDFSQYAGRTLILYNDAPAAFPAFVGNNDYYTGAPDMSGSGGHVGPKAGIGPNTRTLMQIKVAAAAPAAPFDLNALISEFATTPAKDGVFKSSQEPVIVGQSAYDTAYNHTFPSVAPYWGVAGIADQKLSFETLNKDYNWSPEVVGLYPMEPKALHDEMGAVWDEYGRMSAKLGLELPNTNNINQIFIMQNYVDKPTENMQDGKVQIWKLTHNGVDTHPLHFHLFDVQVINRVGWDGFVRLPWPNELGWKETVRVSPLEDTIVAMRPKAPPVPWTMPQSSRLMNPPWPVGTPDGFMNLDPATGLAKNPPDTNQVYNYADEYVWHCHILSHEEQDMMRTMTLQYPGAAPLDPAGLSVAAAFQKNILTWTDQSYPYVLSVHNPAPNPADPNLNRIAQKFFIERCNGDCTGGGTFNKIAEISMIPSASLTYNDGTIAPGAIYTYRVRGYNRYTQDAAGLRSRLDGFTNYITSAPVTSQSWPQANAVTLEVTNVLAPTVTLCAVNSNPCPTAFEAPAKFVAQASGSTAPYQYRFSLNNGTTTTVVQNYSATRYWTLPVGTAAGNYTMTVDVRTNAASTTPDISRSMAFTLAPTIDSTPPVTTAFPAAGAFLTPVQVYLLVNEPGSVIKYTIDNSDPTTSATAVVYAAPVSISATTTLKYFATDPAGNPELVQTGLYELRPANLNASVAINGGSAFTNTTNVTLTIAATGAVNMQFSNDNVTYTAEEPFAASKAWVLAPAAPDGPRTVYVRFRDANGILQSPVPAQITLDTTLPVTTPGPLPGTFITPVSVSLTADQAGSTIRYTLDGTNPVTSPTAFTYTGPITVAATTAIMYYATDPAGNAEAVKTSIYTIHTADLVVNTFSINTGAAVTTNPAVTLSISATDVMGVIKMRFSNDGVTYTADEPYAISKAWTLGAGDGLKTVYVRFTDGAGLLYDPVTAQITLDTTAPVISATPPAGSYLNQLSVYMTANEAGSTIKYTVDGSDPTLSATAQLYTGPISVVATTTLKYYAIDAVGNAGAVTTALYTLTSSINASAVINAGASLTNSTAVTLTLAATGIAQMQFSNNGVNYSALEPFATSKGWTLDPGDGAKTVFVRFVDGAGVQFNPIIAQITLDTIPPVTTATPAPGIFIAPVQVTLTADSPNSTIHYTTDGSDPKTSATVQTYLGPITIAATSTLNYYTHDIAGNQEAVKSGLYEIHVADLVVTTFTVNGGATVTNNKVVSLSLAATDAKGVAKMRFSNDGVIYSADETYATTKGWTLSTGDGVKTVYVRFTDGAGLLYDPVTAQITLDTTAPVTTASVAPGTFISAEQVILTVDEAGSTIKYTTDGSDPTTSATAVVYSAPIAISATTTLKYFATDAAGNAEAVKGGLYDIHTADLVVTTFAINGGATITDSVAVTLNIDASDATGVTKMRFSNDGVNYSADEPYATSKSWTLAAGDGPKTVYVRFTDGAGLLYAAVTAHIALDATYVKDGLILGSGTYLASALKALMISGGRLMPTAHDLFHGDVAPYYNGASHPDGKIDALDAFTILMRGVGLISGF